MASQIPLPAPLRAILLGALEVRERRHHSAASMAESLRVAMRDEHEQDFAQERAILRTLRGRWLERVLDDQVRGEDALRYVVEAIRSAAKKTAPPKADGEQPPADGQASPGTSDRSH